MSSNSFIREIVVRKFDRGDAGKRQLRRQVVRGFSRKTAVRGFVRKKETGDR